MYTGYLQLGNIEIANTDRLYGYLHTADCVVATFEQTPCGTLAAALGHAPYEAELISEAPWYDPTNPDVSSRFLGIAAYDISGIHDSTRNIAVTQAIRDGGILGAARNETKSVKVKALLYAKGQDALDYGLNWLNAALAPGACGQHGDACGVADLSFYTTCPPPMTMKPIQTPGDVLAENLFPGQSLRSVGDWVDYRRNEIVHPILSQSQPSVWTGPSTGLLLPSPETSSILVSGASGSAGANLLRPAAAYAISLPYFRTFSSKVNVRRDAGAGSPVQLRLSLVDADSPTTVLAEGDPVTIQPGAEATLRLSGQLEASPSGAQSVLPAVTVVSASGSVSVRVVDGWTFEILWRDFPAEEADLPLLVPGGATLDVGAEQRFAWEGTENSSRLIHQVRRVPGTWVDADGIYGTALVESYIGPQRAAQLIPILTSSPVARPLMGTILYMPALGSAPDGWDGGQARVAYEIAGEIGPMDPSWATEKRGTVAFRSDGTDDRTDVSPGRHEVSGALDPSWGDGMLSINGISIQDWASGARFYVYDLGVYDRDYSGPSFVGGTTSGGSAPDVIYEWLGDPNESASRAVEMVWDQIEDWEAYSELVRPVERYMHDVAATSPPTVREYLGSRQDTGGVKAADVEFTITSERGYIYERPRAVPLLTVADAYEDVQRNILLNPTTDQLMTSYPLRRNLLSNPSLESSAAWWTATFASGGAPVSGGTTGRVAGELRIAGNYSMKAVTTNATPFAPRTTLIMVQETVPSDGRFVKIGIWGGVLDPSLGLTDLRAEYAFGPVDSGTVWQVIEVAPSIDAARSGYSYKSSGYVQMPAAAETLVSIRFVATGNANFTAYADAAMIIEG